MAELSKIRRDVRVFISAVTKELGTVRRLVEAALKANDYHAVMMDDFPLSYRDLRDKLRERIASCDAVIHIAGVCYGAEPKERPDDAERRSYTQMEYDLANELGKPVYVFLTGDNFPDDPHDPEPNELRELQQRHRQQLTSTGHDYKRAQTREDLDREVRSLQLKVERLEEELTQVDDQVRQVGQHVASTGRKLGRGIAVVVALVVVVVVATLFVQQQQRIQQAQLQLEAERQEHERLAQQQERAKQDREREQQEAERLKQDEERHKAARARQQLEDVKQVHREYAWQLLQEVLHDKHSTTPEIRERAISELCRNIRGLSRKEIVALIDQELPQSTPETPVSPNDQMRKALAHGKLDEALRIADEKRQSDREFAMLEGTAALAKFRESPKPEWNERALASFHRALVLCDREKEPKAWAAAAQSTANVLYDLARYSEAEPLFVDTQRICEKVYGANSLELTVVLNNKALLLKSTNRLSESEPLLRRALAIVEQSFGPEHPDVAIALNNLASLLRITNRLSEAEPLMDRALTIFEKAFGAEHPNVAITLNNVALLLKAKNRLVDAEPLMRRALAIVEQSLGPEHPNLALPLNSLALLLMATNRLSEAEPLMRRVLAINEQSLGPDHPDVATALSNLALLLQDTDRLSEAEPLMRRGVTILEKTFGADHPDLATALSNLAQLFQETNRLLDAELLMRRVLAINEQSLGPEHTDVAIDLNNLAQLLRETNRLSEAEPLMRRALAILEKLFGPEHPDVAINLNNLALLLKATNRLSEAEPLMRRALAILEKLFGPEHPDVAINLNNLASMLQATYRLSEAEPLMRRHVEIFRLFGQRTGHEHSYLKTALRNYQQLLKAQELSADEIAARIAATRTFKTPFPPVTPDIERLLGPTKPVADVLAQLDQQNKAADKPQIYFLPKTEPISPHLDGLLKPSLEALNAQGLNAFRNGRFAESVFWYDLALNAAGQDELQTETELTVRMNHAAATRDLRQFEKAKSALEALIPQVEAHKDAAATAKGRVRYHLAVCERRLGNQEAAQRLAEESLKVYADDPASAPLKVQSEKLLADIKSNQPLPPLPKVDFEAELAKVRAAFAAREALASTKNKEPASKLLDQMLGPAKSTQEVLNALDESYRKAGKPRVWYLPLNEPIAPHLDLLLGPIPGSSNAIAIGDWDTLLNSTPALLPARLAFRVSYFLQRDDAEPAAQAAAKLHELAEPSSDPDVLRQAASAWEQLGIHHQQRKNWAVAREAFLTTLRHATRLVKLLADSGQEPLWNLGGTWTQLGLTSQLSGDFQQAALDYQSGIKAAPGVPQCHNNLAWLLATCPDKAVRDGKRAIEAATKACELTEWKSLEYLDTLAAACAEAGDFAKAVEWQQKAVADPAVQMRPDFADFQARLKLYQSGQPYHEPAPDKSGSEDRK